jgi:YD repeat-containing protein
MVYSYDAAGDQLQATGAAATQHDAAYGTGFITGRGNVTAVSRYDVSDISNDSKALTMRTGYDTDGSPIFTRDALNHQTSLSYADSFSDGNNSRNTFAYPSTVTDADGFSSSLQYNYDFGAKTRAQGPPPAGQSQGAIQTISYDAAARAQQVTTANNGAYTRYVYGPNYVQSFSSVNSVADDAYAIQVFDGAGQVIGAANNHPGSAGGYSMVNTIYDLMGRAVKRSNPTEINSSWVPAGDDAAGMFVTQQSYDWKGRPLVTTNTDNTTKQASYGGCGCAGGEVVTLTDEVGRRQKVYSDVVGRTAKSEVLNWDGSVYSAAVNTYNARDQVTFANAYSGQATGDGSCPSGTCQQTSMTYDGYGRLKTKHAPEQQVDPNNSSSTDHTIWDYFNDDKIQKVTDARGATCTYGYNGRHLVTSATHTLSGQSTIATSYSYDAAGNRTGMTDGSGSTAYSYNVLSQMTSETRTFTGVGSFTLSYDYNLAGELKKVTDATNTTINYGYDGAGRLNAVTGLDNLVGGVSNYASGFQYRAWGALKQISAGASHTASFGYNARLRASHFDVSGGVVNQNYDYFNDGRISFVHNTTDNNFDRAYTYDHAGRLTAAASGGEARHDFGAVPTYETFEYNAWDNTTYRFSESWLNDFYDSASYTNGRRTGWGYDADGRIASIDTRTYGYDAAGRNISLAGQRWVTYGYVPTSTQNDFDGDGYRIREISDGSGSMTTTYYLRSSVLGGAIIEELNSSGQKQLGYVYTPAGSLLARQVPGSDYVLLKQISPIGASQYEFFTSNTVTGLDIRREFDPAGAKVPLNDHSGLGHSGAPGDIPGRRWPG